MKASPYKNSNILLQFTRRYYAVSSTANQMSHSSDHQFIDGIHPLVDMAPILTLNHRFRQHTLRQIKDALVTKGYFYAQNVHTLPSSYLASIYDYSKQLHNLPSSIKEKYSEGRTYNGPDVGKPELNYDPNTVSTVRSWDYSRTRFTLGTNKLEDVNWYPDVSVITPPYMKILDDLYERQNVLAKYLLVAFADMFQLPSNTFIDMFNGPDMLGDFGTIRLLHYPGRSQLTIRELDTANAGISAHTDFELFTLMHQNASGLQFLKPTDRLKWIDAPVRPEEFVVIVGDVFERFTNGLVRATPHRVLLTSHPRSSLIRFIAVHGETVVQPLPQLLAQTGPPQYGWVKMKTHMETTMRNLDKGMGTWDPLMNRSTTATYNYVNGLDHNCL